MTRIYKTARGKAIDVDKVKLANETVIAVGNMKVNARGDAIGRGNQVVAGRNQLMDQVYAIDPDPGYSPSDPENFSKQELAMTNSAEKLTNLVNNLTVPLSETPEVESTVPAARGSLASSIAKTTVVDQQPIPDPRKPKGPSRI
jgi:hypothetical protein